MIDANYDWLCESIRKSRESIAISNMKYWVQRYRNSYGLPNVVEHLRQFKDGNLRYRIQAISDMRRGIGNGWT